MTWVSVPNFGGGGTNTFQVQFESNGNVHMIWQSMSQAGNGWVVGWTPGGGPMDPGSIDLTSAIPAGFNLCASSASGITLSTNARPILGTTVQQITSGIQPGTAFGLTMMSHTQSIPPVDLTPFGMAGCEAHLSSGTSVFWFSPSATVQVPLTVPNAPVLTGLPVVSQSFSYNPPMTTLGLIASNGIVMVVGPQ